MTGEPAPDPRDLRPATVDRTLKRLGETVTVCIAQWRAAGLQVPEVSDKNNPALDPRREPAWPDPEYALMHAQWVQASNRSNSLATMARDFAGWWADAVTVAMVAAVRGTPVDAVRLNAGDPSRVMLADDLDRLSSLSSAEGAYIVFYDGRPGPRRDQLWGEDWSEHQVPLLPSVAELIDLLTAHGVRVDQVADIGQAREAIADALSARRRALAGKADDEEASWEHAAQLTDLLADYARLVTTLLPVIRPAES